MSWASDNEEATTVTIGCVHDRSDDYYSEEETDWVAENKETARKWMLITQARPAHKYPNPPWEAMQPPGGDNAVCVYRTRSTRLSVTSHSQPLINAEHQYQVTNYL
jgi:hypothetical protein